MTTVIASGTSSPITVPNLAAGNWKFSVQANNGVGLSAASALSSSIAITAPPATNYLATGATSTSQFTPSGLSTSTSADNTSAIQNAINAANSAGGGTVTIPAGVWYINGHILVRSNVNLAGAGANSINPSTTLKAGGSFYNAQGPNGGYPLVTTNGATNVSLTNFIADGSSDQHQGIGGERLSGYHVDVRNSTNALITWIKTILPISYQIVPCTSTQFTVAHCTVYNATNGYDQCDGLHVLDSNNGQVIHNTVDNRVGLSGDDGTVCHSINADVYNIEYGWNYVRAGNNGGGLQLALGTHSIHDINIHDCEIYDSPYGIRSGGYGGNGSGSQYNISITRCNIHDVRGGTDFPNNSGPSCSVGDFYVASGNCYGNSISNIRVANYNVAPAITGGTITNVLGASAASPVVGVLGA